MSKMRTVALAGAVVCAAVAGLMAKNLLSRKQEVHQEVVTAKVETVDILVAAKDMQMGDKLADALTWKSWPKANVINAMISKDAKPDAPKDYALARARQAIYTGEPIIEKKILLANSAGFMSAILPKGYRAISVAISSRSSAGGFILPNDRVDVILTRKTTDKKSGQPVADSETVLSNVRVLAVNQIIKQAEDGGQIAVDKGETATLELTPQQSEAVAQAESSGELSLALRSLAENEGKSADEITPQLNGHFVKGKSDAGGGGVMVMRAGNESYADSQ